MVRLLLLMQFCIPSSSASTVCMGVLGKKVNHNLSQGSYESTIVGKKRPIKCI